MNQRVDQSNTKMLQTGNYRLKRWSHLSSLHFSFLGYGP